jgi:alpha-tubulin suppressor-like RCC1 family protein
MPPELIAAPEPRLKHFAVALTLPAAVLLGACGDSPTDGDHPVPAEIRLLSPGTNSGTPGWPLSDSVVVEVLDANGDALSGVPVTWNVNNDADGVGRPADTTNAAGRASAEWTLGRNEGAQTLSIAAGDLAPVTVVATATILHAASVSVGGGFACALTESGQAFCWGSNLVGQLGNGTTGAPALIPQPVAGDMSFTVLTASGAHVCGLTAEGVAYCWGGNESGETGTGTAGPSVLTPMPVQTTLRFMRVSAEGSGNWPNSTCALTANGEAWCWGNNSFGQLGSDTTTDVASPIRVQSNVTFSSIRTGYFHSCAVATSGELWCWGQQDTDPGAFGALALGLYRTPVALQEDFRFTDVTAGLNYSCALTADDAAFCWGSNFNGGLARDGTIQGSAEPLLVPGGHTFVALSAASWQETHALTDDGALYRWGDIGFNNIQSTPLQMTELHFTQIDSGDFPFDDSWNGACGIAAGNRVYCVRDDGLVRGVPTP